MSTMHDEDDFVPATGKYIADRIRHTLTLYPKLSPSMLQVGIGTAFSPKLWHPVIDEMIASGEVIREETQAATPTGRAQTYIVLSLSKQTSSG